ncbi:hypothetical protein HRbin13_00654 [bacterium HR13]|nr:hypothetical protein HRbin13_00654 [bacterium HR13]
MGDYKVLAVRSLYQTVSVGIPRYFTRCVCYVRHGLRVYIQQLSPLIVSYLVARLEENLVAERILLLASVAVSDYKLVCHLVAYMFFVCVWYAKRCKIYGSGLCRTTYITTATTATAGRDSTNHQHCAKKYHSFHSLHLL